MVTESSSIRTTFTASEATEVRGLLDALVGARLPDRRMSMARLRHMRLESADDPLGNPTRDGFEASVAAGSIRIDPDDGAARAVIQPQSPNRVFRVAVGTSQDPVGEDWDTFQERFQWFGGPPSQVGTGDHLFVLAVGQPWLSAVVGLYEAVSPGAVRMEGSSDPARWPVAMGVRPLAAVPLAIARRVEGQTGPQSGYPEHIRTADQPAMYAALAESLPPPGPGDDLELRIQQVEWIDVEPDVMQAVASLGSGRRHEIIERAIEIGSWNHDELQARAWYTISGARATSHVEQIVGRALDMALAHRRVQQLHSRYSLPTGAGPLGFGLPYRRASDQNAQADSLPRVVVDLDALDRATRRHMALQNRLFDALRERDVNALSPNNHEPQFDLGFVHADIRVVVEVKSGVPPSPQQVRLGVGQVLEYRALLEEQVGPPVVPALFLEKAPPRPWPALATTLGVHLITADRLEDSLGSLLQALVHRRPSA